MKIAIVSTHPIQYHIPWFVELSSRPGVEVKVYYGCQPDEKQQGVGFGTSFKWDIPMHDSYDWQTLENAYSDPSTETFFSSCVRNMDGVLRRDRPDVLILTGWQALPLLQALWAGIRLRIPCLMRGESSGLKPRGGLKRLVHRLLLSQLDAFLVIGEANRRFYSGYGIADAKLFPCPYFVENKRILAQARAQVDKRSSLREHWGIPPESICYLYVGKLVHKKHLLDQLAALRDAKSKVPGLHMLVVGDGELMGRARAFTKTHNLPVSFAGFLNQTEITSAYMAADCMVISSDYDETWGLVTNEAMVCGLPVIASDRVGCSLDLVKPGETGETFPFGDINALSDVMVSMAKDSGRLRQMGARARDLVLQHYSPEVATDGTIRAVEAVLNRDRVLAES